MYNIEYAAKMEKTLDEIKRVLMDEETTKEEKLTLIHILVKSV